MVRGLPDPCAFSGLAICYGSDWIGLALVVIILLDTSKLSVCLWVLVP